MKSNPIRLNDKFGLPLEVVTESVAILAKRRVGKSYTGRRLVEQLHQAGQQIVIVDPKGDWWGIRSSADGKSPGLPIVIVGGEHGDIPLETSGGELVARMAVEQHISMLLDLSQLRKREVKLFMTDFLETLYRLKAKDEYRVAMMLVIDEADAIAPQRPDDGEQRMLGAAEDLVRRGGQRGVGVMLITQRAAVLNKNVLTQCGVMILLRTIGPQDIEAVDGWMKYHGQPERRALVMRDIASLPLGTAQIWAPGWPDEEGIFERVQVGAIETFDSGMTPKPGQARKAPKTVADVDLAVFRKEMAATLERVAADDPKALRKRIAELEKAAKVVALSVSQPKTVAPLASDPKHAAQVKQLRAALEDAMRFIVEINAKDFFSSAGVQVDQPAIQQAIEAAVTKAMKIVEGRVNAQQDDLLAWRKQGEKMVTKLAKLLDADIPVSVTVTHNKPFTVDSPAVPRLARPASPSREPLEGITPSMQRVLDAIAWWESANLRPNRHQVAFVARYSVNGHFNNMVGSLRTAGLLDYPSGNAIALTEAGRAAANSPETKPTREELIGRVHSVLRGDAIRKVFAAIVHHAPDSITRDDLATESGYTVNGHFNNMVGSLVSLGVAEYPTRGQIALAEFFKDLP